MAAVAKERNGGKVRFSSRNVRPSPPHCVVAQPKETAYPSTFTHWQASYSLTLRRRQKERKGGGGRAEMDKREGGGKTRRSVGGRRQEMECSHSVSLAPPSLTILLTPWPMAPLLSCPPYFPSRSFLPRERKRRNKVSREIFQCLPLPLLPEWMAKSTS